MHSEDDIKGHTGLSMLAISPENNDPELLTNTDVKPAGGGKVVAMVGVSREESRR